MEITTKRISVSRSPPTALVTPGYHPLRRINYIPSQVGHISPARLTSQKIELLDMLNNDSMKGGKGRVSQSGVNVNQSNDNWDSQKRITRQIFASQQNPFVPPGKVKRLKANQNSKKELASRDLSKELEKLK